MELIKLVTIKGQEGHFEVKFNEVTNRLTITDNGVYNDSFVFCDRILDSSEVEEWEWIADSEEIEEYSYTERVFGD